MSAIQQYTDKSTLLTLFEQIQTKILANVTEISEVVVYSNQENNEEVQRPFTYPYVSVQMVIDWDMPEAIGNNTDGNPPVNGNIGRQKKGIANIVIHTMFYNRNDDTKAFLQNEAIRHKVHRAVDLLHYAPFFTEILKVQDQLPIEIDASQDYPTTYICSVKEGALLPDTSNTIGEFGISDGRPAITIPTPGD